MRITRLLPACAAVFVLAACGSDSITAPAASNQPRFDLSPAGGYPGLEEPQNTNSVGDPVNCTIVLTTRPDGTTTLECQTEESKQHGSGG